MASVGINDPTLATFGQWLAKFRETRALQRTYREQNEQGA
jgi:hypothetical protein